MIAWLLVVVLHGAPAQAAEAPDLFPAAVLEEAARAAPDEGASSSDGASTAGEGSVARGGALAGLSWEERELVQDYVKARRRRNRGLLVGALGTAALIAGVGLVRRGTACVRCGDEWNVVGGTLVAGGVIAVPYGGISLLVGTYSERRTLSALGVGPISFAAIITGWSCFAAQLVVPGFATLGVFVAGIHQARVNDQALEQWLRSTRGPRAEAAR